MTVIEAQRETAKILREGGVENAMQEARYLLEDALGMDNVQLVTSYRNTIEIMRLALRVADHFPIPDRPHPRSGTF